VVLRGCGLLAGAAMVVLQCLVVVGVITGTGTPACGSSDQCHQAGMYCAIGANDRCMFCGAAPLPPQTDPATGGVLNDVWALDFAGYNLTAVAELCADPSLYMGGWQLATGDVVHTVSSIVSWCKSDDEALVFLFPTVLGT
jgi:hypothetical protein